MPRSPKPDIGLTDEECMAALGELRVDVETKLADAEELAQVSGKRGTGRGAEPSRQDALSYRRQLALLDDLRGWLLEERARRTPAEAPGRPADGRDGVGATDGPVEPDRVPAAPGAAS